MALVKIPYTDDCADDSMLQSDEVPLVIASFAAGYLVIHCARVYGPPTLLSVYKAPMDRISMAVDAFRISEVPDEVPDYFLSFHQKRAGQNARGIIAPARAARVDASTSLTMNALSILAPCSACYMMVLALII